MVVSVIIPAYNPQEYLLGCLDSVFNQTAKNIEIILVNDGSAKECEPLFEDILQRYPEIKILNLMPNKGVACARNHGVANAGGDTLCFIDQDDMWAPDKLERQSQYLDTHAECDYVTSRQRYFLSDGVDVPPNWLRAQHLDVSLPGFLPGTLMVRAPAFRTLGGFDEQLKAGTDDVDWFFRANAAGLKTFELPEDLLLKRIHGKNLSAHALAHNKELLAVVRTNLQRKKLSGAGNA
jgi:glycosyltransferase involved in cell wall biosynthesis